MADCYELLGSAPYTTIPPDQAFRKAEEAARKALALDNTLAKAHVSLGYSEMVYDWNLPEAQKELASALQLRPDYATAHQFYAYDRDDCRGAVLAMCGSWTKPGPGSNFSSNVERWKLQASLFTPVGTRWTWNSHAV